MADHPQTYPDGGKNDTTDYSASKAPETRDAVEHRHGGSWPDSVPGGPRGASADVGMSGIDGEETPTGGLAPGVPTGRSE